MTTVTEGVLTKRQRAVHRYMLAYQARQGRPASITEIQVHIGLSTIHPAHADLAALIALRMVKRVGEPGTKRRLVAIPQAKENGHAAKTKT